MKHSGFTLIELLIVIAIIGVLAAVLVPNLMTARSTANDTAAKAYMREVLTGIETARDLGSNALPPPSKTCAELASKASDPGAVIGCWYKPDTSAFGYTLTVQSASKRYFQFDGEQTVVLSIFTP